jgi:hypothetical protein
LPAILAAAVALSSTVTADAFVRSHPRGQRASVRWSSPRITLTLDTKELPSGLERGEVLRSLQRAAARWSRPAVGCTAVVVEVVDGSRTAPGGADDGRNSIVFHGRHWCQAGVERRERCYDPRTASLATLRYGGTAGEDSTIREADIELNAVDFAFTLSPGSSARAAMDLETVVVHDIGHVLGFDHVCGRSKRDRAGHPLPTCESAAGSEHPSVMVPAGDRSSGQALPVRRQLAADDAAGVCAVYPAAPAPARSSNCGCRVPPDRSTSFVAAIALSLAVVLTARRHARAHRR